MIRTLNLLADWFIQGFGFAAGVLVAIALAKAIGL